MLEGIIKILTPYYQRFNQELLNLNAVYVWTLENGVWRLKIPESEHLVAQKLTLEYSPNDPKAIKPFTNEERGKYSLNPGMHGPAIDALADAKLLFERKTSLKKYHLDYKALFSKGGFIYGIKTVIDDLPLDFRTIAGFMSSMFHFEIDQGVRQFQRFFNESNLPLDERNSIRSLIDYKPEGRYW